MPGVTLDIGAPAPGLDAATRLGFPSAPDLYADFTSGDFRFGRVSHGGQAGWQSDSGAAGAGWGLTFGPVVTGGELLANGGFDADVAGWSAAGAWPASLSWQSGKLRNSYAASGATRFQTTASTTPGRAYRLRGVLHATTSSSCQVGANPGGGGVYSANIAVLSKPATGEVLFATDAPSWPVGTLSNPSGAGQDDWDDFSVREIMPFAAWSTGGFSLFVKATAPASTAGTQVLFQADAGGSERDRVRLAWGADEHLRLVVTRNNVEQANLDLGVVTTSTVFEVRCSVAADEIAGSLNGAPAKLDAAAAVPGIGVVRLGRSFTGEAWTGDVKMFGLWFGSRALAIDPAQAFAIHGDSTGRGDGATTTWFAALAGGYSPGRAVYNDAASGQSVFTLRDRMLADTRRRDWPAILYDRRNTGETAAAYLEALETAVSTLTGRFLILPQVAMADGAEAPDVLAVHAEINAGIRARWPGNTLDAAAEAALLGALAPGSTRSDGLHRNNAGQAIEAAAVRAWLDAKGW
ncbi:MAG: hypothetical protein V4707_08575 [Pseudomonadota bacterium]